MTEWHVYFLFQLSDEEDDDEALRDEDEVLKEEEEEEKGWKRQSRPAGLYTSLFEPFFVSLDVLLNAHSSKLNAFATVGITSHVNKATMDG